MNRPLYDVTHHAKSRTFHVFNTDSGVAVAFFVYGQEAAVRTRREACEAAYAKAQQLNEATAHKLATI